jgi:hypothetical protein
MTNLTHMVTVSAIELVRMVYMAIYDSAGSDGGSPNHGSTLFSKRVMALMRSPVRERA